MIAYSLGLLTYDEISDTIRPGVQWAGEQVDAAANWSSEKWDGFVSSAEFAANYVKDGVVDSAKFVADAGQDAWNAMVEKGNYVVEVAGKYYDITTDAGADAIKAIADAGEVTAEVAAGLALLAYDEVEQAVGKGLPGQRIRWTPMPAGVQTRIV